MLSCCEIHYFKEFFFHKYLVKKVHLYKHRMLFKSEYAFIFQSTECISWLMLKAKRYAAIFPYTLEASEHFNTSICTIFKLNIRFWFTILPLYIVLFLCCLLVFSNSLPSVRKTRIGKKEKKSNTLTEIISPTILTLNIHTNSVQAVILMLSRSCCLCSAGAAGH